MSRFSRSAVVPSGTSNTETPEIVSVETVAQYAQAAVLSLLIYDAATTMDKEVKYFWRSPLNSVTVVYFANRYIGLLGAISSLLTGTFEANLALQLRDMVEKSVLLGNDCSDRLYPHDQGTGTLPQKTLTVNLVSLLVIAAAVKLAMLLYITSIQRVTVYHFSDGITTCGEDGHVSIGLVVADWTAPMLYGLVLLVLASIKAMQYWKTSSGFGNLHLLKVLIQDQVIYFVLVVSCCLLNILQFKLHVMNDILAGVLAILGCPSLLCVLGARLLFNLKDAGEQDTSNYASDSVKSVTNIEFVVIKNV